jgi:predicted ATP-grasp superfamily ATP-dependent carboligase
MSAVGLSRTPLAILATVADGAPVLPLPGAFRVRWNYEEVMSTRFRTTEGLVAALEERSFDRPPALVANAHVTGLSVARALAAHGVPVVALDRTPDGVAPGSKAVEAAGAVTYPLDDLTGFREDVEAVAAALDHEPVAFACMDEWVHAFADSRPEGVRLPFAADRIDGVLDKTALYALCEDLGVPYPETYRIEETGVDGAGPPVRTAEAAAEELGFPLVVKPALKREFEEAVGTNVVEVDDREAYQEVVAGAADAGIRVMAQERVNVDVGEDRSLASYRPESGDPVGVVGSARARYPEGYGTSCVVDRVDDPDLRERALSVLDAADYHGISEAEFVRDADREAYVLLDVNTRPWKWIGMPVAAGANLPMAAYADAVDEGVAVGDDRVGGDGDGGVGGDGNGGVGGDGNGGVGGDGTGGVGGDGNGGVGGDGDGGVGGDGDGRVGGDGNGSASAGSGVGASGFGTDDPRDIRWVYLADYLQRLADGGADVLSREEWLALTRGAVDGSEGVVTGAYDPDDPEPGYQLLRTELGVRDYYCAC